jgi:hypothetical protein
MHNDDPAARHSAYYRAAAEADDDLHEAIGHIRAQESEGHITVAEAAAERCEVLTRHLERLEQLRAEYLGGSE